MLAPTTPTDVLRELHIRNLAVLASAAVEFGPGLNVLTGETGAGKSIVVDSLALLGGARASSDLIRSDAEVLTVAGVFECPGSAWRSPLEEAGIEVAEGEVLVRREISRTGRNRVFVNDQPTTLKLLAELAPHLLRIHGQREELGLVAPDLQRAWLDRSGGEEAVELVTRTTQSYEEYAQLAARLERLEGSERLRQERMDLLRFQAAEIDAARLEPGEEETLRAERNILRNADAIARSLGGSLALLFEDEGAAVERLAQSQSLLREMEEWEPVAGPWVQELAELRIRLEELADSLRRRLEGIEVDPRRLDAVEERLAVLERLCRKYGGTTGEILARRREMEAELAELEGGEASREELESRVAKALARYREAAEELSARRRVWAQGLVERMVAELSELGLEKARLAVGLEPRRREGSPVEVDGEGVDFGPHGIDQVVFLFSSNPGEDLRPLSRVASGGELSRIYLALQLAAREETDEARPTLIFDEVDVGIGGAQAAALGRKLQRLARGGQILAVTHLPQVASYAHLHFRVSKTVRGGRTHAVVSRLSPEERVEEVARMLAGKKVTHLSRSHAQELIAGAERSR